VSMSRAVWVLMLTHAQEALPNECCGLLVGTSTSLRSAYPARNLRDSPTRYLIDPLDHFAAIKSARRDGTSVVGAYHSHPASPAAPSPTDEQEALDDRLLYVIVSPQTEEIRGYRLVKGCFREIGLQVCPTSQKTS